MVVGSSKFIERARRLRKPMGGGLRQSGLISAPARVAVEETFLEGKLAGSHEMTKRIAGMWVERGGKLERECETNMVWFDLGAAGWEKERFVEVGVEEGVKVLGGRVVVHYQIGGEGVRRLGRVMDRVLLGEGRKESEGDGGKKGVKRKAEEVLAPEREYGGGGDGDTRRGEGVGAI